MAVLGTEETLWYRTAGVWYSAFPFAEGAKVAELVEQQSERREENRPTEDPGSPGWVSGAGEQILRSRVEREGLVKGVRLPVESCRQVELIRWNATANSSLMSHPLLPKSDNSLKRKLNPFCAYRCDGNPPDMTKDLFGKIGLCHERNRDTTIDVTLLRCVEVVKPPIAVGLLSGGDVPP